jgi:two-component system sensor histidine kinase MprB
MKRRIALAAALAVTVAVATTSVVTFVLVRSELLGGIDRSLRDRASRITSQLAADPTMDPALLLPRPVRGPLGGGSVLARIVTATGGSLEAPGEHGAFPLDGAGTAVARGLPMRYATVHSGDVRIRILAVPLGHGRALELARPLDEVDAELDTIAGVLIGVSLGGIVLGGLLGLLLAGRALAPVRRLAAVVDHVARTRRFDRRAAVEGNDELSRLTAGFNGMLTALDEAQDAQRRLVAEASHELRTPVTCLRTDIGLLRRPGSLDAAQQEEILAGLDERLAEMSDLLRELMELAEGDLEPPPFEAVRLDMLVEGAVARLRRHRGAAVIDLQVAPVTVAGAPALLERAITNLLDNAAKWSPAGAPVEVNLSSDGAVVVRDHGPGVPPEDRERIFERFFRGDRAQGVPGSGLGLAIVRSVAEAHAGSIVVEPATGGGSRFTLTIPPR